MEESSAGDGATLGDESQHHEVANASGNEQQQPDDAQDGVEPEKKSTPKAKAKRKTAIKAKAKPKQVRKRAPKAKGMAKKEVDENPFLSSPPKGQMRLGQDLTVEEMPNSQKKRLIIIFQLQFQLDCG